MRGYFYCQSYYNLLKSLNSLEDIVKTAIKNNYDFVSLSDDENLYGMIEFLELCYKYKIKPVIGIKIKLNLNKKNEFSKNNKKIEILVYAKNDIGINNLIKLSNIIKAENKEVYLQDLQELQEGIFVIISILDKFFFEKVNNYFLSPTDANKEIIETILLNFKEKIKNFYIGISLQANINVDMIEYGINDLSIISPDLEQIEDNITYFADKLKIKILPTHKTKYLEQKDNIVYEQLIKLNTDNKNEKNNQKLNFSFLTKEEFILKYDKFPKLMLNLQELVSKINYSNNIFDDKFHLPKINKDVLLDSSKILKKKTWENFKKKINTKENKIYSEYVKRLKHELKIISQMKYEDYFLIVADIISYAKKNNILVGPGRGSSVGSLVCFCLDITEIDPLKYDLIFERFLNPQRTKMPDIDLDFPDNQRENVINYVKNKYKNNNVANLITFLHFPMNFLIDKIANNLYGYTNTDNLKKKISKKTLDKTDYKGKEIERIANIIIKIPRTTGTHISGIILSQENLLKTLPLQLNNNNKQTNYQTQFEDKNLQKIGLFKIDFLGIKALTLMNKILKKIKNLEIKNIPLDDIKTYNLLKEQKTISIFQLESTTAKNVLKKIQPCKFSDLIDVLGFNRPGTINFINEYIRNKNTNIKKVFLHPLIHEILKPTHGVIIYQEQIMQIIIKFANYNLIEADNFRNAISKKDQYFLINEKNTFIKKSMENGNSIEDTNKIYDHIYNFANYGFNKSHSVAYALITYRMSYLKTNYQKEFNLVLLNQFAKNNDWEATNNFIKEIKTEMKFIKPNIFNSSNQYNVLSEKKLIIPLISIKGVDNNFYQNLIKEKEQKKFENYENFKQRLKISLNLNKNENLLDNLIFSGALDIFGLNRRTLYEYKNINSERPKEYEEFSKIKLINEEKKAFKFDLSLIK
ncbi:DNA polymerase III, alpha subunit [Candidatus Phytoplasma mali]|uniref:DNA-directed DNA polymerase n=1 Tax=Phytoplasma mali (strain AT) TaxID=482235 RepID=B3R0C0_PHYMT|nr:DNA polymerase III subunit alpha [Candidatus Phytoplasma mali]CAP18284.1 DNA polymerase III, alpha subunit [Candidatus Phytoplasma mali]